MVRLENISAFRRKLPSSSNTSKEVRRQKELSDRNTDLFARELMMPYFFTKESYSLFSFCCSLWIVESG